MNTHTHTCAHRQKALRDNTLTFARVISLVFLLDVHMYLWVHVHVCGGLRTTLSAIPQALSSLLSETVLTGLEFTNRRTWMARELQDPRISASPDHTHMPSHLAF